VAEKLVAAEVEEVEEVTVATQAAGFAYHSTRSLEPELGK
jgi:hypothetical protein